VEFLLKLSPDQDKFAIWGMNAAGPTLVKGGPGSGKSTVALYRVRELLKALRQAGTEEPHILFTTYTNALVTVSRQLLQTMLGEDIRCVDVRTADSLAYEIAGIDEASVRMAKTADLRQAMREALRTVSFQGSLLERQTQMKIINALGEDYLIEEVTQVIEARQLTTIESYLAAPRPGRRVPLNELQRTALWRLRELFLAALERMGCLTWQRMRARAEEIVRSGQGPQSFDAVLIDEAQDLDPSLLRMLAGLCRSPNRLFVTADANQSIYGSGFRWSDVHESLQFRGRTGILRANYRSTKEIGEAARSYLGAAGLDAEWDEDEYIHSGGIQPAMRKVQGKQEEGDLLARFLPQAARHFLLGIGACVVLCPTERSCQAIADSLVSRGLEATFMTGKDLDLARRTIKVMTHKSSKGLEFPIVALAGFLDGPYPFLRQNISTEEREEELAEARRTLFVAMTRAMRALLLIAPEGTTSPLLSGFAEQYWNV
jgi:superfamily I DNA/RNA helicase